MRKILDITRVAFSGQTGDDRSPESFPFPACMTSLMHFLGEDYPVVTLSAHKRSYTHRTGNDAFLAATGMAFGLLWHPDFCLSSLDLTQVNEEDETIRRGFAWAGYTYEILEKSQGADRQEQFRQRIVASLDQGVPVLAFGIIGPPECLIICGYDQSGAVLLGWSHFQGEEHVPTESNGMFRKADWFEALWKIVLPGQKVGRTLTLQSVLEHGLAVMQQTASCGYMAGYRAYDAWIDFLSSSDFVRIEDSKLQTRHTFHHALVGSLAEARCWGSFFLKSAAETCSGKCRDQLEQAAGCFMSIHDLCWKTWGILGDFRQPDWQAFRESGKRGQIAAVIREIRTKDEQAMRHVQAALT